MSLLTNQIALLLPVRGRTKLRAGSLVVWVAYRGQGRRSRNRKPAKLARRMGRGELFLAPFFSPASPACGCGSAALTRDTLPKQEVSLLAG